MVDDGIDDFEEVDPRSIWPNEARDFTPWLAANIHRLTRNLPFDLASVQIERELDGGYVDIAAMVNDTDTRVVVENQLGDTDDDHLARILTYAATYDARIILWVATGFSERHRRILNWLNRNASGDVEFYGVQVKVIQIGRSDPAPIFEFVVEPTDTSTRSRTRNPNVAVDHDRYPNFFQTIVDELSSQGVFEYETVRSKQSWFEFKTSLDGVTYVAAFTTRSTARVKLHIRCRVGSNHRIFENLSERKKEIEDELREPLSWEERSRGNQHRHLIGLYRLGAIDNPEDELSELSAWMIENLTILKQVFDPYLDDVAT